ncbi:MAG: hypothetical protein R3E79_24075 [Caldilineaceae bacterium]
MTLSNSLIKWESTTDETILATARELIQLATDGNPPPLLDPFAGGGSIPLEAQRLGLEAHASDLNPVAVMINKAMIEIPPRFANRLPGQSAQTPPVPGRPVRKLQRRQQRLNRHPVQKLYPVKRIRTRQPLTAPANTKDGTHAGIFPILINQVCYSRLPFVCMMRCRHMCLRSWLMQKSTTTTRATTKDRSVSRCWLWRVSSKI